MKRRSTADTDMLLACYSKVKKAKSTNFRETFYLKMYCRVPDAQKYAKLNAKIFSKILKLKEELSV